MDFVPARFLGEAMIMIINKEDISILETGAEHRQGFFSLGWRSRKDLAGIEIDFTSRA